MTATILALDGSALDGSEGARPDASWRSESVCRKHPTRWWFAGGHHETVLAKAICAGCPVRTQCLEFAISRTDMLGIWAATTPNERATMRRARRAVDTEAGDEVAVEVQPKSEVEVGREVEVRLGLDLAVDERDGERDGEHDAVPTVGDQHAPPRRARRTPRRTVGPDGAFFDRSELLTPAEAARKLGVTPNTVTRWSRAGKIPAIQTMGGHRRFRRSEIERVLQEASLVAVTRS